MGLSERLDALENTLSVDAGSNTVTIGGGVGDNVTVVIQGPVQLRGDLVYIKQNRIEYLPEGQMWVDENGIVRMKVTEDTKFVIPPTPSS
jgi:hypothetical protein